jgi:hypothetical protein
MLVLKLSTYPIEGSSGLKVFNKCLLSTYCGLGTVLNSGDIFRIPEAEA